MDMYVFLGRQMSNGHFICPLDISNVHWIQWTIGHYTHSIYPRCPFPVVTKSGLVHWIQLTLKYPMDIRYVHWTCTCPMDIWVVHWIQWTVICPMDISYVHWTFALVLDMYEPDDIGMLLLIVKPNSYDNIISAKTLQSSNTVS